MRDREDDDDVVSKVVEDHVRKWLREKRAAHAEEERPNVELNRKQPLLRKLRRAFLDAAKDGS